ncbi:hypothetical protein BKA64DRAFT_766461 [Cadophora sp. MPI-SDFR-AT-0126]|nr:hypothetical protein BKA64DRAFT_766461 [Leotiomycetes sp. MPI-SDFR-AT-0126]
MYFSQILLVTSTLAGVLVRGTPVLTETLVDSEIATNFDARDIFEPSIQWKFEDSDEFHSAQKDATTPSPLLRRDTLIPANDPSLQTKPVVSTGSITKAQLAIWVAEGSTMKTKRDSTDNAASLNVRLLPAEEPRPVAERQTIPIIAETTRIFGNQGIATAKETVIAGPFKTIETWVGPNTLSGMRLTDNNDVVVSVGTINTSSDTYKYFVFGGGEIIKALRIWASSSGGYERFTGFDFTTNLGNTFLCGFQVDPTDDVAITRNVGGGFIYAIHASVVSNKIYNFGIDMVAPVTTLKYDAMNFTDFVNGEITLTNGAIVTAGRLLLDNRNTSVSQSAQLRLDSIETYARAITSRWLATAQVQQAFGVSITAGLPVVGSTVSATTTIMVQGQYGEEKQITTTSAIDYGAWGTIVCPAGRVCRAQAVLTRWAGFTFNFVATMKLTTTTGAVWTWKNRGTYQGTDFADWIVTLGEYTVVG